MEELNMPTVEDFRAAFGLTEEQEPEQNSSQENPQAEPEQSPAPAQEQQGDNQQPASSEQQPQQPEQPQQQDSEKQNPPSQEATRQSQIKQNQAFARMRTENAQMQKTLSTIAEILGVDPRLPAEQLTSQLQQQALGALAKQRNIDPAIMQRLDQLEQINEKYVQMEIEKRTTEQFQNIKSRYNATDDDLVAFVQDIMADGYDIADPKADLELEFLRRNFNAIQKRAIDAAVLSEQERTKKAGGASKPDGKQGQDDKQTEDREITSVSELNDYFSSLSK